MLAILIENSPKLRILILDQTKLGDHGVADLFGALLPLQTRNMLDVKTPVPSPNNDSETAYRVTSLNPISIKERGCGEEVLLWTINPPTTMSVPAIESLAGDVARSDSLVVFYAGSIHGNGNEKILSPDDTKARWE